MNDFLKFLLPALAVAAQTPVTAADWPGWLGSDRNGVTSEKLPEIGAMVEKWRSQVGIGNSGVAVSGGNVVTLGHDGEAAETIFCLDAGSGEEKWRHVYPAKLMPNLHTGGPNATPLIDRDRVYSVSKDGQVICLDLSDGDVVWKQNLAQALGTTVPTWGFASSPVLLNGQLIFTAGRTIALDPRNGKTLWRSEKQYKHGYSTVAVAGSAQKPLLASMDGRGLSILNSTDGVELARFPLSAKFNTVAATPVVLTGAGDELFVATNMAALRLKLSGDRLEEDWQSKEMQNNFSNSLFVEGFVYGIDGKQKQPSSRLACIRASDGDVIWSVGAFGHGSMVAAAGVLWIMRENGELVAAKLNSKSYKEIGRRRVFKEGGYCWTPPSVANECIFLRSQKGALVCLGR